MCGVNGDRVLPLETIYMANDIDIGRRNWLGMSNALRNRVIGIKGRGVYGAPGMELLGSTLQYVYQATIAPRASSLCNDLSTLISNQIYNGRLYDPAALAALKAIEVFTENSTGTIVLGLYKGRAFFRKLTDCPATLYNEEGSSMEANDGLNAASSQGYVEIQRIDAVVLSLAGQIASKSQDRNGRPA